jgi:hypothetical protein
MNRDGKNVFGYVVETQLIASVRLSPPFLLFSTQTLFATDVAAHLAGKTIFAIMLTLAGGLFVGDINQSDKSFFSFPGHIRFSCRASAFSLRHSVPR